jgi:hypothetical protein
VVAHGRFSQRGFARAIEVAARAVQEDVIGRTRAALSAAGALRPAAGSGGGSDPGASGTEDEPDGPASEASPSQPDGPASEARPSQPDGPASEAAATVSGE